MEDKHREKGKHEDFEDKRQDKIRRVRDQSDKARAAGEMPPRTRTQAQQDQSGEGQETKPRLNSRDTPLQSHVASAARRPLENLDLAAVCGNSTGTVAQLTNDWYPLIDDPISCRVVLRK